MKISLLFAAIAMSLLSGCATGPQSKYDWGNYEQSVYSYYKEPANIDAFSTSLNNVIQAAELNKRPVAPGVYAEYGYLLTLQGKTEDGLAFFDKEKKQWPESAVFMDTMKKVTLGSAKKTADEGVAK
ncbi:DUF4810 domain-containing protein [Janthinobacterium agaricidamnosum]|uniref:Putative lipoprotein n=1 Tax=Janthinobacterium agaricidamnosum NBRC 102515 = DSM 9628 TaxID=1349767 RepID=W0UZM8_9BURK|nr:DUF4810 domain-containing protein [Janthinobacterium agaricidamnosum]CDG81081.1 putative lipoprotein [Janthinobacterium agaricidamnosum NBRC 102515 = DSM 9628]